jgi:Ca2+-binding EF-hand superfamily protein
MSGKQSDWRFGSDHDELIYQAFKRKSPVESANRARDPAPVRSDVSVFDLADRMIDIIENNFDSLFDCFQQFDVCGMGRISRIDFHDGVRSLSKSLSATLSDSIIEELFCLIDLDHDGELKLQDFVSFFRNRRIRISRTIVKSDSSIMPVHPALKMATARYDLIASETQMKQQVMAKKVLVNLRHQTKPFKMLPRAKSRSPHSEHLTQPDFEQKNQWIDRVMKELELPLQSGEIKSLDGKWDKFLSECRMLDALKTKHISAEGFRNALTRSEPKLPASQIEWYLRDANKNDAGEVLYEDFIQKRKNQGISLQHHHDFFLRYAESLIKAKLKINFPNLKQAYKQLDVDRDGRISKSEFIGMLRKLKIDLKPSIMDSIFLRLDLNADGFAEYQDFIQRFSAQSQRHTDVMSDDEISAKLFERYSNISDLFRALDKDGNGSISTEEFCEALVETNIFSSFDLDRAVEYTLNFDQDGNGIIDFRDFLQFFARTKFSNLQCSDSNVRRWIELICERLREKFDDSKQAFHAFDRTFDCRLSIHDFLVGAKKFVLNESELTSPETMQNLERVFSFVDSNGDGFMDYHDFISKFEVKMKKIVLGSIDGEIRIFLRSKFPASITEAFHALDVDQDNRLSSNDFKVGLQKLGKSITESELVALFRRSDLDQDSYVDYDEFVVRFGLEAEQPGRWVYKIDEPPPPSVIDKANAEMFKAHMLGSKWWGRGGVIHTLTRYDRNRDGKLECREGQHEFKAALMDDRHGLGMSDITDDYIVALLGGPKMEKPYCILSTRSLDIQKFGAFFIDVHFDREKDFFKLLLVQNKWMDIMDACDVMSTINGNQRLISKADLAACLQSLVEQGTIRAEDKKILIDVCIREGLFIKEGIFAGYLDYGKNLFERCIGMEMQIHGLVFPHWQHLHSEMLRMGGDVNYFQFEDICKPYLSSSQITWLIDVMDSNNDGHISSDEFVRRYARAEDQLSKAVQAMWMPLLTLLLQTCRKQGAHADHLPPAALEAALIKAIKEGCLDGVSQESICKLVKSISKDILSESGDVNCKAWICRYAGHRFKINEALERRQDNGLPLWDAILAELEQCQACHLEGFNTEAEKSHLVSREQLRAIFSKLRISLAPGKEHAILLDRFLMDLDSDLSGFVDWVKLVQGQGVAAHYYFSAEAVVGVRQTVRYCWKEILHNCSILESTDQVVEMDVKQLHDLQLILHREGPGCLQGRIPIGDFRQVIEKLEVVRVNSLTGEFEYKLSKETKTRICQSAEAAFCDKGRNRTGETCISYWELVLHFAADEVSAEVQLIARSDAILSIILSLSANSNADGMTQLMISKDHLSDQLRRPGGVGLPDLVLRRLVGGSTVSGGMVDAREILWRCCGAALSSFLDSTWPALYCAFRTADISRLGRLPLTTFVNLIKRGDLGLTAAQVEAMEWLVVLGEDQRVDYGAVLCGSGLAGACKYRNFAFEAWLCLESDAGWTCIAQGLAKATSKGNVMADCIFYSEVLGFGVPAGLIRAWMLGAKHQYASQMAGLTAEGLDKCLQVLRAASEALSGSRNMGNDVVFMDLATWLVCGDKMRFEFGVRDSGRLSQAVLEKIHAAAQAEWDRAAQRQGLDGYSRLNVHIRDFDAMDWGLKFEVAERCVAEALVGVPWLQGPHVAALVRLASLDQAQSSMAVGNSKLSVTASGMAAALQILSLPIGWLTLMPIARKLGGDAAYSAWWGAAGRGPVTDCGVQENRGDLLAVASIVSGWLCAAAGAAETVVDDDVVSSELRGAMDAALEASRPRHEWYLPEGPPWGQHAGKDSWAARRTGMTLTGCCVLHDGGHVWPQPLARRHLRAALVMLGGGAPGSAIVGETGGVNGDSTVDKKKATRQCIAVLDVAGTGGARGVKGVSARRGAALYSSHAWQLLCDSSSSSSEVSHVCPSQELVGRGGPLLDVAGAVSPGLGVQPANNVQSRRQAGTGPGGGCKSADLQRLAEERQRSGVYDRIQELRGRRGTASLPAGSTEAAQHVSRPSQSTHWALAHRESGDESGVSHGWGRVMGLESTVRQVHEGTAGPRPTSLETGAVASGAGGWAAFGGGAPGVPGPQGGGDAPVGGLDQPGAMRENWTRLGRDMSMKRGDAEHGRDDGGNELELQSSAAERRQIFEGGWDWAKAGASEGVDPRRRPSRECAHPAATPDVMAGAQGAGVALHARDIPALGEARSGGGAALLRRGRSRSGGGHGNTPVGVSQRESEYEGRRELMPLYHDTLLQLQELLRPSLH